MDYTSDIRQEMEDRKGLRGAKLEKWKKSGLLEGLHPDKMGIMATLLENQAVAMLRESTTTSDIKGFQAIAFPLVRRTMGKLLAQEIVSVQPLSLPSGLLFWLDFKFGSTKAGTGRDNWTPGGSIYGNPLAPLTGGQAGTGGHYNLHNSYTQFEASGAVGIASSGSATWSEVNYDPALSSAVALSQLFKVTVDYNENANITNVDTTNHQSMRISGTVNSTVSAYAPRHNRRSGTVVTIFYSGSQALNSGSSVQFAYVKKDVAAADTTGTTFNPAFEYAYNNSNNIPEINMHFASIAVNTQSRKLKAQWTPEAAQDIMAYHNIDAENEVVKAMSDLMAADIDAEILRDLVNNAAAGTLFWDRRPGFYVDRTTGAALGGTQPTFYGTPQEWYNTLLETILDVSNLILKKTLRSGANFLVTSPEVCTLLEMCNNRWRPVLDWADTTQVKFSMGVEKAGSLDGRFTVYKAPFFPTNEILVGYKGTEWLDAGYVYSPYIPMILTPTIYDPTNLTPVRGVATRYAKQPVNGAYFGRVVVKGL